MGYFDAFRGGLAFAAGGAVPFDGRLPGQPGAAQAQSGFTQGMNRFGTWMGGDGQNPGFMGTGQFQTDPNQFVLPGNGHLQSQTQDLYQNAMGTQAPQLDQSQANQFRGQQGQLSQMLMNQANGTGGPSVADQQMQAQTQRNVANSFAMAQANPNDPGALRNIANQTGNLNQQAAQQGAQLRSQEQLNAQGLLSGVLQGARGQDLGAAGQNAQLTQNQFGLDNQAALGALGLGFQGNNAQLQGNIEQQKIQGGAYANSANNQLGGKIVGGLSQGLGTAAATAATGGAAHGGEAGADFGSILHLLQGGDVPGHAQVEGDSAKNDTVHAMLSPGEVVLPRSVMEGPDAAEKASLFVKALEAKHRKNIGRAA